MDSSKFSITSTQTENHILCVKSQVKKLVKSLEYQLFVGILVVFNIACTQNQFALTFVY